MGSGHGGKLSHARPALRGKQFFQFPNMIGEASFHRGSNAKAGMYAAEVVVSKVQRDGGFQVRPLFL